MKNPTTTLLLLIGLGCFIMFPLLIQAQESNNSSEELISSHSEEIAILSFTYSASSRAYEVTSTSTRPFSDEEGQLAIFLAFDDSDEFIYLPESEEDIRMIRKGSNQLTYQIDPMGMIKLVIQNPSGGTPWSTLDVDKIQLRQYFMSSNVAPLFEWEIDLEDEEVLSSLIYLSEEYVQEQLTNR